MWSLVQKGKWEPECSCSFGSCCFVRFTEKPFHKTWGVRREPGPHIPRVFGSSTPLCVADEKTTCHYNLPSHRNYNNNNNKIIIIVIIVIIIMIIIIIVIYIYIIIVIIIIIIIIIIMKNYTNIDPSHGSRWGPGFGGQMMLAWELLGVGVGGRSVRGGGSCWGRGSHDVAWELLEVSRGSNDVGMGVAGGRGSHDVGTGVTVGQVTESCWQWTRCTMLPWESLGVSRVSNDVGMGVAVGEDGCCWGSEVKDVAVRVAGGQ